MNLLTIVVIGTIDVLTQLQALLEVGDSGLVESSSIIEAIFFLNRWQVARDEPTLLLASLFLFGNSGACYCTDI